MATNKSIRRKLPVTYNGVYNFDSIRILILLKYSFWLKKVGESMMTAQKNEMSICMKEVHDWCRKKGMILDMVLIHFLMDFPYWNFNRFHHDKLCRVQKWKPRVCCQLKSVYWAYYTSKIIPRKRENDIIFHMDRMHDVQREFLTFTTNFTWTYTYECNKW